ncbi:hypothetical protein [Dinghuibacter silviterrae]|uniref:Uncharacterized protein n=1 Tax=Dinghuibacter silviterrae TaxID=1539049 RepID=A0A4R8DHF4_9BACT|nr:hypothetical protein [Dinghuibacter silviterrae]TDW97149.1 hypothetical protein EDB95_4991 [Dinghuibacter silviterrae]
MAPIKKAKKVTIKFFLNQLLEPVTGDKGQAYYPLYIQVTFNRKNMTLKSKYAEYYQDLKEVKPELMAFEERILRKIISHEAGQGDNDYDLKGLKHKYEVYSTSIGEALENYLKPKLRSTILKTNDELTTVLDFQQTHATVGRLYKAAKLLFSGFEDTLPIRLKDDLTAYGNYHQLLQKPVFDFSFATVLDWVDGGYQDEQGKKEATKRVASLIDQAVKEQLKQL